MRPSTVMPVASLFVKTPRGGARTALAMSAVKVQGPARRAEPFSVSP